MSRDRNEAENEAGIENLQILRGAKADLIRHLDHRRDQHMLEDLWTGTRVRGRVDQDLELQKGDLSEDPKGLGGLIHQ